MGVKFGVAGLSHFHAEMILKETTGRPDMELVALSGCDADLRDKLAGKFGIRAYEDPFLMCEAEGLEAVAVVENPDSRSEVASELLGMGVDVLLDKPAALDFESLEKLEEAAGKGPGRLFPFFTVRYERPVAKALWLIRSGTIGKVSSFTSLRPHKLLERIRPDWFWRIRGGVIVDLAVHDLDIYRAVCGFPPDMGFASFGSQGDFSGLGKAGFVDSAQFMMRPDIGPAGTFLVDWLTPEGDPRHGDCAYFIAGTEGRIEIRGTGGIPGNGEVLVLAVKEGPPAIVETGNDDPHDIYSDFLAGERVCEAAPGWKDMIIANRMALAAAEAARTGRTVRYDPR